MTVHLQSYNLQVNLRMPIVIGSFVGAHVGGFIQIRGIGRVLRQASDRISFSKTGISQSTEFWPKPYRDNVGGWPTSEAASASALIGSR
jgi:hypothetical protein